MILSEEIQERLQSCPRLSGRGTEFHRIPLAKAEHETVQEERWLWSDLSYPLPCVGWKRKILRCTPLMT